MTISLVSSDAGFKVSSPYVVNLSLTGTEGNLQVAMWAHRTSSLTPDTPSGTGWNEEHVEYYISNSSNRRAMVMYWREVPASAGSTVDCSWDGESENVPAFGFEFSTDLTGGAWSMTARDDSAHSSGSTSTSLASGSAGAPATSEGITVAGFMTRYGDIDTEVSYSNSFTGAVGDATGSGSSHASCFGAYKISGSAETTTASWSTSAAGMGIIAAFSHSGSAGGGGNAAALHYYRSQMARRNSY